MNNLLKYLGVIILLIGVAVLAIPAFLSGVNNTILLSGSGIIVLGYLTHIFLNRRLE
ncbi:MAG: hypothetical protein LBQ73_11735 [Tannerellaceae bacterium]|jgi:hypothetical protein|nr:hypothetical protein [Tannerellaceae bacterium]